MTNELCIQYCNLKEFKFASTLNGYLYFHIICIFKLTHYFPRSKCLCSNDIENNRIDVMHCSSVCTGNTKENCGGLEAISVYEIICINFNTYLSLIFY